MEEKKTKKNPNTADKYKDDVSDSFKTDLSMVDFNYKETASPRQNNYIIHSYKEAVNLEEINLNDSTMRLKGEDSPAPIKQRTKSKSKLLEQFK